MHTQASTEELILNCEELAGFFDIEKLDVEIADLESKLSEPNVWDDSQNASKLNKQLSKKMDLKTKIEEFKTQIQDLKIAIEISDESETEKAVEKLKKSRYLLESEKFLNKKFDSNGAILSVHSGAGGIDAQDWASMILSMYQAFTVKMNWKHTVINLSVGEEGGVKSATLEIEGENAYGFLKEEAGVHRLIRLSPFNSGHTRETSFCLVEVIPNDVENDFPYAEIPDSDLKWDTFMSAGKGGQSVNTTYSAVRLTHIPTGIVVTCQNERNQIQNRQTAMKYLKNKLAILEAQKEQELKAELRGEFQSAEWGSQIRNYILHPYKLVKDLRSGFESTDPEKILETGDLLDIIWSVKIAKARENSSN